jgi:Type III restriction enzyme, res subunit
MGSPAKQSCAPPCGHASILRWRCPKIVFQQPARRKYTGLLDHQGQILRTYAKTAVRSPDVGLQLPTGSGKTLVGLLIAEWRRRKFGERALYLCPTKQLVNQVAEEARTKYGMDVDAFTGSKKAYDPGAKARYQNADGVAITTYSSLFNAAPFFREPHLVIVDDAHTAENYIAQMWTLRVQRFDDDQAALFYAIAGVLKSVLPSHFHARLIGEQSSFADKLWVDKLPTPDLIDLSPDLIEVLDHHVTGTDLQFAWRNLRVHFV